MDEKVIRRLLHLGATVAMCPLVKLWMYEGYYVVNGYTDKDLLRVLKHLPAERVRAREINGKRLTAYDLHTWKQYDQRGCGLWVGPRYIPYDCNIEDKIKELLSLGVISE